MADDQPNLRKSLRQVLLEMGYINEQQYEDVWEATNHNENRLPELLVMLGMVTEAQLIKAVGISHQAPYFDKLEALLDLKTTHLLDEDFCRNYTVIALFQEGKNIMVAMLNPYDLPTMLLISERTGFAVKPVVSSVRGIHTAITTAYNE